MKKAEVFPVYAIAIFVVVVVIVVAATVCLACNKFAFQIWHCFVSLLLLANFPFVVVVVYAS